MPFQMTENSVLCCEANRKGCSRTGQMGSSSNGALRQDVSTVESRRRRWCVLGFTDLWTHQTCRYHAGHCVWICPMEGTSGQLIKMFEKIYLVIYRYI